MNKQFLIGFVLGALVMGVGTYMINPSFYQGRFPELFPPMGGAPLDTDEDGMPDYQDPDDDNDGIFDEVDNCPNVANPDQLPEEDCDQDDDGIPDNLDPFPLDPTNNPNPPLTGDSDDDDDSDGIPNADDNCPNASNSNQKDADKDGIGDECDDDRDGDGIPNDLDKYPDDPTNSPPPAMEDPDGDSDFDGIPNSEDNCPGVSNPGQEDKDKDGNGDKCDDDRDGDGIPNVNDPDEPDYVGPLINLDQDAVNNSDFEEFIPLFEKLGRVMDLPAAGDYDVSDITGVDDAFQMVEFVYDLQSMPPLDLPVDYKITFLEPAVDVTISRTSADLDNVSIKPLAEGESSDSTITGERLKSLQDTINRMSAGSSESVSETMRQLCLPAGERSLSTAQILLLSNIGRELNFEFTPALKATFQ